MKNARALLLVLLTTAVAAIAAGCGSSGSGAGSGDDPAKLVPATAPVYVEATVRPEGKVGTDAEAALRKILHTNDPGAAITKALESGSAKDGDLSFKDDVEPWLGDKVGAAITAVHGQQDADYVIVAASTDDGKANDALDKRKGGIVKRSYKGVDYRFDRKDSTAAAVVDHHVLIGTDSGLRSAIDASKGDSLADATNLRAVRSKVARDRVGLFYLDVQGLFRTIGQNAGGDPQVGALLQSFSAAAPKAIGAALQAQPDVLRVDAVSIGTPDSASTGASGADALAALPADSWLGLGVANIGKTLDRVLQTVTGAGGLTGVGVNAVLGQFKQKTGLDLREDVLSWMGDAGVFVGGTSNADLRGALVVKTTDAAKTKRSIAALRRLAAAGDARVSALSAKGVDDGFTIHPASGPNVDVALAGDKFIVSLGSRRALSDAMSSGQTLGSAPAFTDAATKLGNDVRPSFFLDFPQVVGLIEAAAGSDPDFLKAKPYLDAFGPVVAGGKDEGDGVTRYRFAVALR